MLVSSRLTVPFLVGLLAAISLPARADERAKLNACQAMVDRGAQSQKPTEAATRPDDPELLRCRQIIREWTLRDSRMSVDEHGRPLR
jgi:hypothetical protein